MTRKPDIMLVWSSMYLLSDHPPLLVCIYIHLILPAFNRRFLIINLQTRGHASCLSPPKETTSKEELFSQTLPSKAPVFEASGLLLLPPAAAGPSSSCSLNKFGGTSLRAEPVRTINTRHPAVFLKTGSNLPAGPSVSQWWRHLLGLHHFGHLQGAFLWVFMGNKHDKERGDMLVNPTFSTKSGSVKHGFMIDLIHR